MHILLTDRLICPRCGPGFGLILIADRLENRRVIEGSLGCPNCRDRFPVEGGFGDLRPPPRSTRDDAPELEPPPSPPALEVAALLGLTDGPGNVALIGDILVADDLAAGRLVRPFDPSLSTPLKFSYYLLSAKDSAEQPKIAAFRDWLIEMTGGGEGALPMPT